MADLDLNLVIRAQLGPELQALMATVKGLAAEATKAATATSPGGTNTKAKLSEGAAAYRAYQLEVNALVRAGTITAIDAENKKLQKKKELLEAGLFAEKEAIAIGNQLVRGQAATEYELIKIRERRYQGLAAAKVKAEAAGQNIAATGVTGQNNLTKAVDDTTHSLEKMGEVAKTVQRVFAVFLIYKGFVFLKTQISDAIKELVSFDYHLALVNTQMGKAFSPALAQSVRSNVTSVAQEVGVTFTEAAKAEYLIVSANIAVADSFAILKTSAKAAIAGGLDDVATAFNSGLSQLNAFGLGMSHFDEVMDKQFNVIKRGIFTYEQYANVVGNVSIAFAEMGQDVESANASIAAISQIFTGPQLEQGATGLRNAVIRMTKDFQVFEAQGIRILTDDGQFRPILTILDDLKNKLDALNSKGRANLLKELFPDVRELRGIQALLKQLPELNQFYIEQKLASGDLDAATAKVSDSLQIQSQIFANQLIPSFQVVVDVSKGFLTFINETNKVLPGFTSAIVELATAFALLKATQVFGRGPLSLTPQYGPGGSMMTRAVGRTRMTPMGLGLGVALPAIGGFAEGQQEGGISPMGALSSIGGGAMMGAMATPMMPLLGAAIGGTASLIALGLGEAFGAKAPEVALTFSEAFKKSLRETAGDVGKSYAQAIANSYNPTAEGDTLSDVRTHLKEGSHMRVWDASSWTVNSTGEEYKQFVRNAYADAVKDVKADEHFKTLDPERYDAMKRGSIEVALEKQGLTARDQKFFAPFFEELIDAGVKVEDFGEVLRLLSSTSKEDALKLAKIMNGAYNEILGTSMNLSLVMDNMKGNWQDLSDVFGRMGDEGSNLAKVFHEIARTQQAASLLQTLKELKITTPVAANPGLKIPNPFGMFGGGGNTITLGATEATTKQTSILEELLGETGLQSVEGMFLTHIQELFDSINPDGTVNATNFFNALFPPESTEEVKDAVEEVVDELHEFQTGTTSLVERVFKFRDAIDDGLITSAEFTSTELTNLGNTLADFNKQMELVNLMEEVGRLGKFAGASEEQLDAYDEAVMQFIQGIKIGGTEFMEIFKDPTKLKDLLQDFELGDINVDQSTKNNFIIRISSDISGDPANLAKIADSLIAQVQNKMDADARRRGIGR